MPLQEGPSNGILCGRLPLHKALPANTIYTCKPALPIARRTGHPQPSFHHNGAAAGSGIEISNNAANSPPSIKMELLQGVALEVHKMLPTAIPPSQWSWCREWHWSFITSRQQAIKSDAAAAAGAEAGCRCRTPPEGQVSCYDLPSKQNLPTRSNQQ